MPFNATRLMPVIVCGLLSLGFFSFTVSQVWRTWGWWTLPAKLVSAEVKPATSTGPHGSMRYTVWASYTYQANSQEYTGHGIRLKEEWFATEQGAEDFANRLRVTNPLKVVVNPANPSEAYLEPGANAWIPLFPAGLLAGLALLYLVKPTRYHRSAASLRDRQANLEDAVLQPSPSEPR